MSFRFIVVLLLLTLSLTVTAQEADHAAPIILLELRHEILAHDGAVNAVAFSPDDRTLASVGNDTSLRLWDVATGDVLAEAYEHASFASSVVFHPTDNTRLVSGGWDYAVQSWQLVDYELLPDGIGTLFNGVVENLVYSPDGAVLWVGAGDGSLTRFLPETATAEVTVKFDTLQAVTIAVSPNGEQVLAALGFPENRAVLLDATTQSELYTLPSDTVITDAVFIDDARVVIAGADASLTLWQLPQQDDEAEIVTATFSVSDWVTSLAMSPDGKLLVVGALDGAVSVWQLPDASDETQTPDALMTFNVHQSPIKALAFSHDGKILVSASADGGMKFWDVTEEAITETDGD